MTAEVPDRSGSPENPLPGERVSQKFLAAASVIAGERGTALLAGLSGLRARRSIADLDLDGAADG